MPTAPDGEKITCKSCAFMDASNPARPFCRRYPAQLISENDNIRALYPVVNPLEDWCGEHSQYCVPRIKPSTEH